MKKSLVVRAGAIVMMLVATFFLLVPDMVRAGGDVSLELSTEVTAEAPEAEMPETEQTEAEPPAAETPETEQASSETPAETPAEEQPLPDDSLEVPADNSETENASQETPTEEQQPVETPAAETSAAEASAAETPAAEAETPETPVQNPADAGDVSADQQTAASVSLAEVRETLEVSTKTVTPITSDKLVIGSEAAEGYIVEGTTITGYQGAGGHIVIPDGITTIGDNAFFGNTTITGVTFPGSLQTIGSSAFNGCSNLAEVALPANVTTVGVSAFANCTGLSSLSLTASTGTVVQGEFYNCISLTSVDVPEGISSIASEAFGSCSNLTSVSLPASLVSLDLNAFAGDVSLASISVAAGNSSYSSYDGCLYTANGAQMLLCPSGKTSVTFIAGLAGISSGAFTGCNYITSVSVPASASTIETDAFAGSSIQSVTIPAEVTAIGSQSSWTPSVIYGYSGSVAESWADENNYAFESLDGSSGNGDSDKDKDDKTGSGNSEGDKVKGNSGTSTTTVTAANPSTASGTTATISQNVNNHVKDATPKTGVEDYGRYFLFAAIMLIGAASFVYSMKLSYEGK